MQRARRARQDRRLARPMRATKHWRAVRARVRGTAAASSGSRASTARSASSCLRQRWLVYAYISLLPAVTLLSLHRAAARRPRAPRAPPGGCRLRHALAGAALSARAPRSASRSKGRTLSAIAVLEDTNSPAAARPARASRRPRPAATAACAPAFSRSASASSLSLQVPCLATRARSSPTGTEQRHRNRHRHRQARSRTASRPPRRQQLQSSSAEERRRSSCARRLRRVSTWSSCGAESSSNPLRRLSSSPVGGASGTRRRLRVGVGVGSATTASATRTCSRWASRCCSSCSTRRSFCCGRSRASSWSTERPALYGCCRRLLDVAARVPLRRLLRLRGHLPSLSAEAAAGARRPPRRPRLRACQTPTLVLALVEE